MSMRVLLCAVMALSVFSTQAGVLPKPRLPLVPQGLIVGVGAVAAGVAAKEHCARRPDQCQAAGEALDSAKEKAGEVLKAGQKKLSNHKLKKALNEELGATGEPPNPKGCEAHHIVPRGENRLWARQSANAAREAIDGCVDLDAVENGVYLPAKDGSQCFGRRHTGLHTRAYYDDIARRLVEAREDQGCAGVERKLLEIKRELSSGRYP